VKGGALGADAAVAAMAATTAALEEALAALAAERPAGTASCMAAAAETLRCCVEGARGEDCGGSDDEHGLFAGVGRQLSPFVPPAHATAALASAMRLAADWVRG
jgi:hypothetical protein